jgi:hypothetical protein
LLRCTGPRYVCRQDALTYDPAVLRSYVPAAAMHAVVSAKLRQGLLLDFAEGDLFFVPPDTLRLELRSAWGEALFDLRAAGDSVCWTSTEEKGGQACSPPSPPWLGKAAPAVVLAGCPGVTAFIDSAEMAVKCTDGKLTFFNQNCRVIMDKTGRRIRQVEFNAPAYSLFIMSYEEQDNNVYPNRYKLVTSSDQSIEIKVVKRFFNKPLNGAALLK